MTSQFCQPLARRPRLRALIGAPLALALAGCVSLGKPPPESLLSLSADASAPAGAVSDPSREHILAVHEPEAPAELDLVRVPVRVSPTEIAYLKDAQWVDKPARLFRLLLAETLRAKGNALVIDASDPALPAASHLRGAIREFGYDAADSTVVLRFDALFTHGDGTIEARRFEARETGVVAKPAPVGEALNRAANNVAGQIAEWIAHTDK